MLKKILLIAPRHRDKKFGDMSTGEFSLAQPQSSWAKGMLANGCSVKVVSVEKVPGKKARNFVERVTSAVVRRVSEESIAMRANKKILAVLDEWHPDVILVSGNIGAKVAKLLIRELGSRSVELVYCNGMSPKWTKFTHREVELAKKANLVLCNSDIHRKEWQEAGANNAVVLPLSACDPELHGATIRDLRKPICDVAFVGSVKGPLYPNRLRVLKELKQFNIGVWSVSSEAGELLKAYGLSRAYRGAASRLECPAIYAQSKITLNIHSPTMPDGGNLSTFEIPGSGGFQIVDACHSDWFEDGKEIILYHDIEDLKEKIRYYLAHDEEREAIALAGRERVLRDHAYKNRIVKILQILGTRVSH